MHTIPARLLALLLLLAAAALIAAGCSDDEAGDADADAADDAAAVDDAMEEEPEPEAAPAPAPDPAPEPAPAPAPTGVVVAQGDSQFGTILFDGDGQVFYAFEPDGQGESTCYGECARAWPPVLTDGDPQAGAGAQAALLGTTTREEGSVQLTYDGRPMYYYVDEGPGEVRCHNVDIHGGIWRVVQPDGQMVA